METFSTDIRRSAFEKLASLSVRASARDGDSEITRLCEHYRHPQTQSNGIIDRVLKGRPPVARQPMGIRELDVLLALCKASSSVSRPEHASRLVSQLSPYLPESHSQAFRSSPFLHNVRPSPWESLTAGLTRTLLSLGLKFPELRDRAQSAVNEYLRSCAQGVDAIVPIPNADDSAGDHDKLQDSLQILSFAVSLVGFLEASAVQTHFWTATEKVEIVAQLRALLSERFMVAIETATSTIRSAGGYEPVKDWKKYARRYAADGRPLGAMLLQQALMRFVTACTTSLVVGSQYLPENELLDEFMNGMGIARGSDDADLTLVEHITDIIADEINLLNDDSDYLRLGSSWQQRLAFSVKASCLTGFLNCAVLDEEIASMDVLFSWLEDTLADPVQMGCPELATVTLKSVAIVARMAPGNAPSSSRALMRFIIQGAQPTGSTIAVAARSLAQVLTILSQDAIITTVYSLGNVLSPGSSPERYLQEGNGEAFGATSHSLYQNGSVVSLAATNDGDSVTHANVVHAIVTIASCSNDEKINALAQSMLLQKIGKVNGTVDACIIREAAGLALSSGQAEFKLLLKFFDRLLRGPGAGSDHAVVEAINDALVFLSVNLPKSSPLHGIFLMHLLENIINKGDTTNAAGDRQRDTPLRPDDISNLLKPLASLVSSETNSAEACPTIATYDEDVLSMLRDAWLNIAVHGITINSEMARKHMQELRLLARHSPPLVAEDRMEVLESDVDLNVILRRGMTSQRTAEQKRALISELPSRESDIKRLNYPKAVFLNAALLVETLRASAGDCTKILNYFLDPALATSEMANCMSGIAERVVGTYLSKTLTGKQEKFSVAYLSKQLAEFFVACCHRIERVQSVAVLCATKIISQCPSALCEKSSLFTLLELLSVMWSSCLAGELDEFDWQSSFISPLGLVRLELPDNYSFRKKTFNSIMQRARIWVPSAINIAPLDVKGLLQTYLSEQVDEGAYGHVSMGRSFAVEMGSMIPQSDQRLGSIESADGNTINLASEFVAQYTARQKYRFFETLSAENSDNCLLALDSSDRLSTPASSSDAFRDAERILAQLQQLHADGKTVPIHLVRDALRRAASTLCCSDRVRSTVIHHLVDLPFQLFTRESIQVGISIWLGVIYENPRAEPRILVEVAEAWEKTVRRRKGLFDASLHYVDPMYTRIELQPSDKNLMLRTQQEANDTLAPHFRLLQFFDSHFNAIKLVSAQTQRMFYRLTVSTAESLLRTSAHPLARELHFRIILFGLKLLKHSTIQDKSALWKLKDRLISAALAWFRHAPRWSYGGNRVQTKAEDKILGEVGTTLQAIAGIMPQNAGSRKLVQAKQDLLHLLLENERIRLGVWLSPLEHKNYATAAARNKNTPEEASSLLRVAWMESRGLAIQLAARFPSSKLHGEVRRLLLNFPEKALDEPAALEILFGSALPNDVSSQLKYLLFWAPVNPMEALTYFLPAYGNHPFILQYAMRALESHSMDVRFYIVPQLVQALRYDALGYVERYIFETAKQSQLFAHQVIWNMKANSYKDEDSQIPDPLKPTLDRFMDAMIASFSDEERDFYEREFSFFNEITGVSGKLRPYIKKSKAEKKEKIEEELRKIKVEVGVYLPSNPDGVVVGIDRKSGKPLQSHAKAPYMATFRIQKTRKYEQGQGGAQSFDGPVAKSRVGPIASGGSSAADSVTETYEVWQSAIFKVGDDCRQDMLALQLIAAFRSIFTTVGLDVWVNPYRVTSTAPGCGVIDVLPNSISRDMLGREAVNGLYDYFVTRYGGEDSIKFQEARTNFVKSMAAYSVISYLLQFKDRHNGNIMIDDAGHIIHIDFGFCFDIAPGGVRFERAPFKLTSEMVAVMSGTGTGHTHTHTSHIHGSGGSSHEQLTSTQPYRWFESLVVKAFLASRPYSNKLGHIVSLMLDSGLPCFKPDTLKNLHDRFVLDKTEREAADFMRELVRKSYMSLSTKGYDQFQLMTNGIPY